MTAKIINLQEERAKRLASSSSLQFIDQLAEHMAYALTTKVDNPVSSQTITQPRTMFEANKEETELVP